MSERPPPLRVLVLEDDPNDAVLVRRALERGGLSIAAHRRVETLGELASALEEPWDIAILDYNLRDTNALAALEEMRRLDVDVPTIVVTGSLDEDTAATLFRAGARDFILKSRLARLVPVVQREVKEALARREGASVEARLADVEASFHSFLEALPAAALIFDPDGRVAYANPAIGKVIGRSASTLVGERPEDLFGPDVGPRLRASSEAARGGGLSEAALLLEDASGDVRELLTLCFPLPERSVGAVTVDLTERRRAEQSIRDSEERLRAVTDAVNDGLVTLDSTGRVILCNLAFERMLGRSDLEIIGRPFGELLDDASSLHQDERFRRWLKFAERDATPYLGEISLLGSSGNAIPVEVRLGSWILRGERLLLLVLRDQSRHRRLEDQLRRAQKMEAVGQLAGGIAHDFNNLLAVVQSYSDLLAVTFEPEDARIADIRSIREAVDRGATLVRQLLAFSRQQVLQPVEVDVNALIAKLGSFLARTLGERINLLMDLDPAGCTAYADPAQIEQILMNLVVNARDAIPGHGRIHIATRAGVGPPSADRISMSGGELEERYVRISVTDDGIGMDETTRARIFDPFFTTKEQGKGTGLGLATVYGIVRQSNGAIEVHSAPGKGASFDIYLPHTTGLGGREATRRSITPREKGAGEMVVLVEDDPHLRAALGRVLRRGGFAVLEAESAEDALKAVGAVGFRADVVLSDVMLPGMSGVELVQTLSRSHPRLPVVLMTGYAGPDVEDAGPLPPVPLLEKPVSSTQLLRAVHDALNHAREVGDDHGE